jgi:hypothetical protein
MRWRIAVFSVIAAVSAAAVASFGIAAPSGPQVTAQLLAQRGASAAVQVDAELILAVDVSYSMDPDEQQLQREGYMAAITSREFLQAMKQGMNGRIAMTYFEWAGSHHQQIIVPWRLIDGPESADGFAADIGRARYTRASRTSISSALLFAAPLFDGSGYHGVRRVIDVSGDGVNNNGPPVTMVRDEVLAKGITINGLPILLKRPNASTLDIEQLDIYYEDCVIGGPGAFVIPIKERDQFKEAIRTKLVLEIAGRKPPPHRASPAPSASACGRSAGATRLRPPARNGERAACSDRRRRHRGHVACHRAHAWRNIEHHRRNRSGLARLWRGDHDHWTEFARFRRPRPARSYRRRGLLLQRHAHLRRGRQRHRALARGRPPAGRAYPEQRRHPAAGPASDFVGGDARLRRVRAPRRFGRGD